MTQALETLLPCPFCGSPAEEGSDDKWGSFVFCTNEETCNALQHNFSNEARAITAWNTRKPCDAGLREALINVLALARLKFGNLDPDANVIFAQADAAIASIYDQETSFALALSDEAQADLKRITEAQAASAGQTHIVGAIHDQGVAE